MNHPHHYALRTEWSGNRGTGTSGYRDYGRQHLVTAVGKHAIEGSSDPTFHGDRDRWNPEELLLAALSQCHMLSYLHVAASNRVVVVGYSDDAVGTMETGLDGGGRFTTATLRPLVVVAAESMVELAGSLHAEAARKCFIAASVNFPVEHEAVTTMATAS
ncbi:OsmC family protein [Luethyella okanaganae]|uniref:OsmC family protein n=1 Tax=Luethyella okanaganae TaxID=69372 RepID=A0ABW1VHS4_9MICO